MQPPSQPRQGTDFAGRFSINSGMLGNADVTLTNSLTTTEPLDIRRFGKGGLVLPLGCGVTAIDWYVAAEYDGTKARLIGDDASTSSLNCGTAAQAVPLPASAENWAFVYAVLTGAASVSAAWCLKD
jgi:hypothetical protein